MVIMQTNSNLPILKPEYVFPFIVSRVPTCSNPFNCQELLQAWQNDRKLHHGSMFQSPSFFLSEALKTDAMEHLVLKAWNAAWSDT